MNELVLAGGCTRTLPDGTELACIVDRGAEQTNLGSTALGVVALAEYQRATGDPRYQPLAIRLTEWMLWMQRPDGSFRHRYNVRTQVANDQIMDLYFSGEAALALARMWEVTGDERYARASVKALDWLVDWYDFFVGGFLYGEEHWTCISAEAIARYQKRDKWLDFCHGLSRFWGPEPEQGRRLAGSAGSRRLAHVHALPHAPQHARRLAHRVADLDVSAGQVRHGRPSRALRREILETLHYLLRQQVRPDNDYAVVTRARGLGAVPASPVDRTVRIDYVQHVASAMIRGVELAEEEEAERARR
ncbi:MAG: hypothetical protein HS111_21700 [Kofleriaceae bacterium]|nr:hypothetical protein [Kofleriaceae bacterium]